MKLALCFINSKGPAFEGCLVVPLPFPPDFLILVFSITFNFQSELNAGLSKLKCSVPVNQHQLVNGKFED